MSDAPYLPIDCGAHDRLLALATLRRECRVAWRDADGAVATARGRITDVYSRDGAEWLRLDDGPPIRLDRLVRVDDAPFPGAPG